MKYRLIKNSYFYFLVDELIRPINYLMAFIIGLAINFFQSGLVFHSLVPFAVPILVQVLSKSTLKYKNRNQDRLLQLPAYRKDPVFVADTEGNIIASIGKTRELFDQIKTNHLHTLFPESANGIIEYIRNYPQKHIIPFLCYSPALEANYMIYYQYLPEINELLVWLQNVNNEELPQR
jgi:hypothetical protein